MNQLATDRVMSLWQWCCDAFSQYGKRLAFPRSTNPTRTYQWRYLLALDKKLTGWEFDDQLSKRFIYIVAEYAKKKKLGHKGLSVFCQENILSVCYDRLREETKKAASQLEIVQRTNNWLKERMGSIGVLAVLLLREDPDAYPNIIKWHQASYLPDVYLALSKSCGVALVKLAKTHPEERTLLPSQATLFSIRSNLVDSCLRSDFRAVLGDDWRKI